MKHARFSRRLVWMLNELEVMEADIGSQFHINVGRAHHNIMAEKSLARATVDMPYNLHNSLGRIDSFIRLRLH